MNLKLNSAEWASLGKGALIACVGALLTYATQWASAQDFGSAAPIVAAVLAVLANYTRKVATVPVTPAQ